MHEGRPLDSERRKYRCALPGYPRRRWAPNDGSGYHMGRLRQWSDATSSMEPPEDHGDGCPGAWYRSRFVMSLLPYERSVSKTGVYSQNLMLSRCDDPLVIEAIDYLEKERSRNRSYQERRVET